MVRDFKIEREEEKFMNQLRKNKHGLIFCLVMAVVLSAVFPAGIHAASPKKNWELTLDGQALFEPAAQKDGSLLAGSYKVTNNVYQSKIMTISAKGKKSGEWSLKADRVEIAGTKSDPRIAAIKKSNGTITNYSIKGKKQWSYSFKKKIDAYSYYMFDEKGNFYLFRHTNDEVYKLSPAGKLVYKQTGWGAVTDKGERVVTVENEDRPYKTKVIKYSASGKKSFSVTPFANDPDRKELAGVYMSGLGTHTYLSAYYYNEAKEKDYYKLLKIDSKGKTVSTVPVSSFYVSDVIESKGNSFFTDEKYFYKMDAKGKIKEKTAIKAKDRYGDPEAIYHLDLTNTGDIIGYSDYHMYKFTAEGKMAWKVKKNSGIYTQFSFNGKQYITIGEDKYVYIYDKNGKTNSKISLGEKAGMTFVTGDEKKKNVFVANVTYNSKTKKSKTKLISVKQ